MTPRPPLTTFQSAFLGALVLLMGQMGAALLVGKTRLHRLVEWLHPSAFAIAGAYLMGVLVLLALWWWRRE